MAKLSRVLSSKRMRKNRTEKSTLVNRLTSRKTSKKLSDEVLLGNMFIKCIDDEIVDVTENHEIIVSRTKLAEGIYAPDTSKCMEFDGKSTNINVVENGTFNPGLDDFTIDWWEYKLTIPADNSWKQEIATTQYSFYKNTTDRKQPYAIKSTDHKSIYISSDGDHWDISDDKFMGTIPENVWVHWAIVRANNNFFTFKDGILRNVWISELPINNSEGLLTIGSGPKGDNFYGYITNFRFVKGQALWVDEFKPINDELFY